MRREPPPARDSGNNTVWEEYIDITFVVANCLTLLITSFVGIAANIFVTFAVYRQKSLQTWNNALLVNLAVIDILRCAIDCPILFTIVITVYQRGHVDEVICTTQMASFSFSCCIQMLTLACISAERHQAIAQPFKISQRRIRIIVLIPLTWTLAIIVAAFCVTYVKDSPVYVKCKGSQWEATSSYDTFGLYMVFPLWATCFGVVIGFYGSIFNLVRSHNRKIFDKGTTAVSKKEKVKDPEEAKKEDAAAAVESQSKKEEQKEPAKQSVAQTDQAARPEPKPPEKESTAAPLTSTREAEPVVVVSESKNHPPPPPHVVHVKPNLPEKESTAAPLTTTREAEPVVVVSESKNHPPPPPVVQVKPNPPKKDLTAAPLTSTKEAEPVGSESKNPPPPPPLPVVQVKLKSPDRDAAADLKVLLMQPQGISENVNVRNKPEDTTQTGDASSRKEQQLGPKVAQTKPKSSNANAADNLKSSPTEPRQVLHKSADQRESKAAAQTNESSKPPAAKAGTEQTPKGDGGEKPRNTLSNKVQFEGKVQTNEGPSGTTQRLPDGCSVPPNDPKPVENSGGGGEGGGGTLTVPATDQACSLPQASSDVPQVPEVNAEVTGAVCMRPPKANKERANKKKESQMAKRSGYIILTFLLFWLPLITTILVNFVVYKNMSTQNVIILEVEFLSVSVACMTSLSDPIIYAAVNPQFRTEFYRLRNKLKATFNK